MAWDITCLFSCYGRSAIPKRVLPGQVYLWRSSVPIAVNFSWDPFFHINIQPYKQCYIYTRISLHNVVQYHHEADKNISSQCINNCEQTTFHYKWCYICLLKTLLDNICEQTTLHYKCCYICLLKTLQDNDALIACSEHSRTQVTIVTLSIPNWFPTCSKTQRFLYACLLQLTAKR